MRKLPIALIYIRLSIGLAIPLLSLNHVEHYAYIAITLLCIGLLTDVFDGIIARKMGVSTQKLRRLDSTVDQLFYLSFAGATYIQHPGFFKANALALLVLISTEALAYLICFIKFRKEVATHSIGAKCWTIILFATLVQLILHGQSNLLFACCFWLGVATRIEISIMLLILKKWANDVPTVYHALRLRQGKSIKRHKLFNG